MFDIRFSFFTLVLFLSPLFTGQGAFAQASPVLVELFVSETCPQSQALEARLQIGEWLVVALKVSIVERQAHHGRSTLFHKRDVCFSQKVVEETGEKKKCLLGAKHVDDGPTDAVF